MSGFTMPTEAQAKQNLAYYSEIEASGLRKKFAQLSFFHAITNNFEDELFERVSEIINSKKLISISKQPNQKAALAGTQDYDYTANRHKYIYFSLGTSIHSNAPKNITFEFPNNTFSYMKYDNIFFCNDFAGYFDLTDITRFNYASYAESILTFSDGIKINADLVAKDIMLKKQTLADFALSRGRIDNKAIKLKDASLINPEFAVKQDVSIDEKDVKIHLVGLSEETVCKIINLASEKINCLITSHPDRHTFQEYLKSLVNK